MAHVTRCPSLALGLLASAFLFASPGRGATPLEELSALSGFEGVDLKKLAGSEILATSETAMGDPRDIFVESCFLIRASPEATADLLRTWNPASHAPLGVLLHQPVRSPPVEADFTALKLDPSRSFIHWFLTKTLSTTREKSDLYLTQEDAAAIAAAIEPLAPEAREAAVSPLWQGLLLKRASAFDRGGLAGLPPYARGKEVINPLTEAERLLKQEPAVSAHFGALIKETCLTPTAGGPRPSSQAYWELSKVSDHAALGVGAIFVRPAGEGFQVVDCQHYCSGSFYLSMVLYRLWPVVVDRRAATLVWRGDFLSSPTLSATHGTERMACGAIMVQEIKKAVRFFREDAEKAAK